jgi:hypothetical protein
VHIVLAEAIGVTIVSLIYLGFVYGTLRRSIIGLEEWVDSSSRRLWLFVGVLFVTPAIFLTSGVWLRPITA